MGRYFTLLKEIRSRAEKIGKKIMIVCGGQGGAHAYKSFIQKGKVDGVLLGFKDLFELREQELKLCELAESVISEYLRDEKKFCNLSDILESRMNNSDCP